MTYVEEELSPDEWVVAYRPETGDTRDNFVARLKSKYDKTVKPDVQPLDFVAGLRIGPGNWQRITDEMVDGKGKAVAFTLALSKSELRLDVGMPTGTQFNLGKVKVPGELEDYRTFLLNLSNWSAQGNSIVSESTFKAWSNKNPKAGDKPTKPPPYKTYTEMLNKSKADSQAFRDWAKKDPNGKKAMAELEKTDKLRDGDPARVKALKAVDATLQAYYKTF